jgi:hypothetical protein
MLIYLYVIAYPDGPLYYKKLIRAFFVMGVSDICSCSTAVYFVAVLSLSLCDDSEKLVEMMYLVPATSQSGLPE